ncbi:aldo-keto reductase family 1 member C1 isoform X2 [Bombina bombina]|uniref:aldo-keto reductase family 1 member C1 isoform X2 n=1 Tax=Bombina bombina TaxID=8345 RepID=UPI00235A68C5|nr:aldo-keto reductase family 1 member C1 isoform X2 [Bombina bombina]
MTENYILLNDGNKIPILGFGTYAPEYFPKSQSEEATKVAIDFGFRHIDGAHLYGNEAEVGRAIQEKIKDGTVKREDLFYTGKLWSSFHVPELIQPHLKQSLQTLQLDYMDLYIIHWPISCKALEECKDAGLVRSIGVSNFNRRQLEMILNKPGLKHKPVCNQVECHPYLNQNKLLEYCKSKDIVLTGYSVLGSHRHTLWVDQKSLVLLDDPVLANIAKQHNKSPAQVALRFQIQRGVVAITKSYNPDRIKENFQIFDFDLSPEELEAIYALNRNLRYLDIQMFADHPQYPFNEEY